MVGDGSVSSQECISKQAVASQQDYMYSAVLV